MTKGTHAMLELLAAAKAAKIPAKHVLFDSWFSSPSTLHDVKGIGYTVIGMVRKTPKMFFRYNGEDMSLPSIYNQNKKRRGASRYLLSVMVEVIKDGESIPAKVVYVRNRNKRKQYLCLISTDITLDENEIMMLSLESREANDDRSLGELFLYLSDEKIDELVVVFMNAFPSLLKSQLQAV